MLFSLADGSYGIRFF
jgi:hypothetical protein